MTKKKSAPKRSPIVLATMDLLYALGEDPAREGLLRTPERVAKLWAELLKPLPFKFTTFAAEGMDEMVVQTGIPFYSMCEHHILPFFGTATVAYIPKDRLVGLSKLSRAVHHYAAGLQNQERITLRVADALEALNPMGVAVLLRARHLCQEMRGPRVVGAETVTERLTGVFRTKPEVRAEFLALARGGR